MLNLKFLHKNKTIEELIEINFRKNTKQVSRNHEN